MRKFAAGSLAFTLLCAIGVLIVRGTPAWTSVENPQSHTGFGQGEQVPDHPGAPGGLPKLELPHGDRPHAADVIGRAAFSGGLRGIPASALRAYRKAAESLASTNSECRIGWPLLAAVGQIESRHARGGRLAGNGDSLRPILGPPLNGAGFAAVTDTDGGVLDGDEVWDRAVGPMQFIPGTWRRYASDGNGDGRSDPHNMHDSTLAAGNYLCAGGHDLREPAARASAVFRYNPSRDYVRDVLAWERHYAGEAPSPTGRKARPIAQSDRGRPAHGPGRSGTAHGGRLPSPAVTKPPSGSPRPPAPPSSSPPPVTTTPPSPPPVATTLPSIPPPTTSPPSSASPPPASAPSASLLPASSCPAQGSGPRGH